jgi:hypothetical protein
VQTEIISNAENGSVGKGRLVTGGVVSIRRLGTKVVIPWQSLHVEERIIDSDQGQNKEVDLANELLLLGWLNGNMKISGVGEEGEGDIAILFLGLGRELEFVCRWR